MKHHLCCIIIQSTSLKLHDDEGFVFEAAGSCYEDYAASLYYASLGLEECSLETVMNIGKRRKYLYKGGCIGMRPASSCE